MIIILSNSLMLNPGAMLALALEKMLYDNSRKMGKETLFRRKVLSTFLLILTQVCPKLKCFL